MQYYYCFTSFALFLKDAVTGLRLYVDLVDSTCIHKWLYKLTGCEIEEESNTNGNWQCGQSFPGDGQQQQRKGQANEYGNEAG